MRGALQCLLAERDAFLDKACAGDPVLHAQVSTQLIAEDLRTGSVQWRPRDWPTPAGSTVLPSAPVTGQILGERYRLERFLGRGGMGEVWQAFDLKLRVEVALKFLLPALAADPRRIENLRREVRTARDVASPHVYRVFDLIAIDGQELVAMEYVDGTTLEALLAARSPLDLVEARRVASQLLSGLEAIHAAGLIHRDLKPANVMITRSGRTVIMDFGLAKGVAEAKGGVAGTPAYMAPEQMKGAELSPRTDLFAVGMILAEMVAPEGVRAPESQRRLWDGLRQIPPQVPGGPWAVAIRRALAADPAERFASAAELARVLIDADLRVPGGEDLNPYPGLAAFTAAEARFFFGREIDVESIWRKLQRMPLVALIGPSGVGKSSFLRAGVIPAQPEGWRIVITTPGDAPFAALGRSLVPDFAGETAEMQELFRLQDPARGVALLRAWRQRYRHALLVLDQFEELFTLNPPAVARSFAELLGRLSVEADIHVLVSMRDDFFFLCHEHPALRPLFSAAIPLAPLSPSDLRRALVEPARLCGYAFEDEALAGDMLAEVEGERGALPLLAFAAAGLWTRRDRERGVISRRAYEEIGHVGGALAQHAEATLERIGPEREGIVREIFRNLVTAQHTRVVRERDDLLSVFPDREAAAEVLRALVDARLLTSFEIPATRGGGRERHRIEIVHESLLATWPRLVRWQTQDTEGALLRDQLRQSAHLWLERGRSADLLWTGTAYKEFELWRERYPGGLTETETAFAAAMEARAKRRRRQRRLALLSSFVVLLVVLGVVGILWRRAVAMTRVSEARRLNMLAENALATDNTVALALATASLEREDNPDVRRLALKALWRAPARFVLEEGERPLPTSARLSPDGAWLATPSGGSGVLLWPRDGGEPRRLESNPAPANYSSFVLEFHPDGNLLLGGASSYSPTSSWQFTLWSVPDGRQVRTWEHREPGVAATCLRGNPPHVLVAEQDDVNRPFRWWRYSLDRDEPEDLGRADTAVEDRSFAVDPTGRYLADCKGQDLYLFPLDSLETASPILVGRHERDVLSVGFDDSGTLIVSADKMGEIRVWSCQEDGGFELVMRHQTAETVIPVVGFDHSALRVVYMHPSKGTTQYSLLDLTQPEAEPILLLPEGFFGSWSFSRDWIAINSGNAQVHFYPLASRRPTVLRACSEQSKLWPQCLLGDGSRLVAWKVPDLWLCDVFDAEPDCKLLWQHPRGRGVMWVGSDPLGRFLVAGSIIGGDAFLIPLDGSPPRTLGGFQGSVSAVALSPDARRAAVGGYIDFANGQSVIRIWDLETGDAKVLVAGQMGDIHGIWFLSAERLVASSAKGLSLWDLTTGQHEVLSRQESYTFSNPIPIRGTHAMSLPRFRAAISGGQHASRHDALEPRGADRARPAHPRGRRERAHDLGRRALRRGGDVQWRGPSPAARCGPAAPAPRTRWRRDCGVDLPPVRPHHERG